MNPRDYRRSITVNASPEAAFRALTSGHSHWWTPCDGGFEEIGDRIKFTFPPLVSFWTFEAKSLLPHEAVELACVEAYHVMPDKLDASESEWLGSRAQWRIEAAGGKTRIDFVHCGLTPDLRCYDVCEAGWDHFFVDSLKAYLDHGLGKPHRAEEP